MRKNSNAMAWIGPMVALVLTNCAGAERRQDAGGQATAGAEGPLLKQLRSAGREASMTVLPTVLGGRPLKQVGEVVGMLLERGGMRNLELGSTEFRPPEGADITKTSESLGEFVKANPVPTDYALFTDFQVSPQHRFVEIRSVVVNKAGESVWQDRLTEQDAEFKQMQPGEPMQCCMLVAQRLQKLLSLDDPMRGGAAEGELARQWEQKSGVPDKAELDALAERQKQYKSAAAKATLVVYPARAGEEMSSVSATNLARLITEAKLMKAVAAEQGPQITVEGDMNEQKMLWSMARAFSAHMQKQPPDADYALYAEYLMSKDSVGAVHFVICDRKGQLVIVDFQNNHHEDFNAVHPKAVADCDRLVVKRLGKYCE